MKKILAILLAMLVACAMMVSCGSSEGKETDAKDEVAEDKTAEDVAAEDEAAEDEAAEDVAAEDETAEDEAAEDEAAEDEAAEDEEVAEETENDDAEAIVAAYVEENSDLNSDEMSIEARGTSVALVYVYSAEALDFGEYGDEAIDMMKQYFDEIMTPDVVNGLYEGIKAECPEVESLIIEYYTPDGELLAAYESDGSGSDIDFDEFDVGELDPEKQVELVVTYINESGMLENLEMEGIEVSVASEGTKLVMTFVVSDEMLEGVTDEMLDELSALLVEELSVTAEQMISGFPALSGVIVNICDESGNVLVSEEV